MTKTASTPHAQLAKAYASEKLRLDPRAGTAIRDEFWIDLAGQLIRQDGGGSPGESLQTSKNYDRLAAVPWFRAELRRCEQAHQ